MMVVIYDVIVYQLNFRTTFSKIKNKNKNITMIALQTKTFTATIKFLADFKLLTNYSITRGCQVDSLFG